MKIELKSPFKEIWKYGYLRESSIDNRQRVDLFNSNTDRTTISYARYLMSVELGKVLSKDFEVDHIDRNCSNDEITNLQVITLEEHKLKTKIEVSGREYKNIVCDFCEKEFQREVRQLGKNKGYSRAFCSRQCFGKFHAKLRKEKSNELNSNYRY